MTVTAERARRGVRGEEAQTKAMAVEKFEQSESGLPEVSLANLDYLVSWPYGHFASSFAFVLSPPPGSLRSNLLHVIK
jgi:hypothetical protein